MKKKYFFGILLSLFLLCGGVFMLSANNTLNQQLDEVQESTDAVTITAYLNYYGRDALGLQTQIRVTTRSGIGAYGSTQKTLIFNTTHKGVGKVEAYNKGSVTYRYRSVECYISNYSNQYPNVVERIKIIHGNNISICNEKLNNNTWYSPAKQEYGTNGDCTFQIYIYFNTLITLNQAGATSDGNTSTIFSTYNEEFYWDTGASMMPLNLPTRTGYTFQGYYTGQNGNGQQWIQANGYPNATYLNRNTARPTTLYAHWIPNTYSVNINIYNPNGAEEHTSNKNGTFTLKDENGAVKKELYNEISGKKITFNTSWQIYDIVPGPGMSLNKVTSTGFTQNQNGGTYTFKCTSTSNLVINIYMKWSEYKIDINFYQPNGSTQEGGTFDLYKKLSGGSETLIQKGLSNEVSGQEYLQYRGQFILKNIKPNEGSYITGVSLSTSLGSMTSTGDPINSVTYTANQTGQPSGGWDNAILIYTSTNNVLANLDCQGGIVEESSSPSQKYNKDGTYLSLPSPTREGYTFIGWNTKDDGSGKYYTSSTNFNDLSQVEAGHCVATPNAGQINFKLYAIWEANKHTITLNDGSGAVSNLADMPWITDTTVSGNIYSYTSGNFNIDYDVTTKDLKLNGTPTSGFVLFLNTGLSFKQGDQFKIEITHKSGSMLPWQNNGYFVFEVCDQNGNNFSTNRQYVDLLSINSLAIGSTYSTTLTINENSANLGKGLKVWYYVAGTPSSQMITNYVANFKITKLGESQNVNKKVVATYDSSMPVIAIPSKFGYTFEGYYDSSGTKYYNANGTSARNWDKDSTATLNAKWTAYNYTLTLYGNDDITSDKQTTKTITGSYASNLTLPSKPFTRSGYIFKGWSTTETGEVTYSDGANYSSLITSDNISITLYAQWKETIASDIESTYSTAGTYYISSADDLAKLIYTTETQAVGNNYSFIQTANIDLSGLTYLPIGRLNSFSGTYDGQGYTISGIRTYDGKDANKNYLETNGGLFANASGANITNVIIENAIIYGQNAGIIAGSGNSSTTISGCIVSGNVNGTNAGSIIGNGNGAKISVCLAKGVNIASFASGSASVDSCIYELNNGNRGQSGTFTKYNEWIYPSNFAYPMPKAFMWYPGAELTTTTLTNWINKK